MRFILLLIAVLLAATACETAVDPVIGTEKAYTIYGLLNPTDTTQALHLYPIEDHLRPYGLSDSLPARVTIAPVDSSGPETAWKGSVCRIEDSIVYLYRALLQVRHDTRYRIVAEGPIGKTSTEVRVPQEAELVLGKPDTASAAVRQPVRVSAPVPNLLNLRVRYVVKFLPGALERTTDTLEFSYEDAPRPGADGWTIPIYLSRDYERMREILIRRNVWRKRGYDEWGILLLGIRLHVTVGNRSWDPPPGGFDPELLVQPGTMSNVENGFGFVAAGYGLRRDWRPVDAVAVKAGFRSLFE